MSDHGEDARELREIAREAAEQVEAYIIGDGDEEAGGWDTHGLERILLAALARRSPPPQAQPIYPNSDRGLLQMTATFDALPKATRVGILRGIQEAAFRAGRADMALRKPDARDETPALICRYCSGPLLADGEGGWSCPRRETHGPSCTCGLVDWMGAGTTHDADCGAGYERPASPPPQPCKFLNGRCVVCGEPESGMCNSVAASPAPAGAATQDEDALDTRLSEAQLFLRDGHHDDLSRAIADARNLLARQPLLLDPPVDTDYWLREAQSMLRSNGSDTHADKIAEIRKALAPSTGGAAELREQAESILRRVKNARLELMLGGEVEEPDLTRDLQWCAEQLLALVSPADGGTGGAR